MHRRHLRPASSSATKRVAAAACIVTACIATACIAATCIAVGFAAKPAACVLVRPADSSF